MISLFAAGGVKGVIGLGLPLTAVSILSAYTDLRTAITFIAIPVVVTNLYQAFEGGAGFGDASQILGDQFIFSDWHADGCADSVSGGPQILTTILGVVVVVYVVINASRFRIRISDRVNPWAVPPLGCLSGLLTGTTGSVGIPIALYLQARNIDKEGFLRAISLTFLISASFLILALAEKGAFARDVILVSAISLGPAFAGMALGRRYRERLSEERFRHFVYLFLIIAAANLIRKGIL